MKLKKFLSLLFFSSLSLFGITQIYSVPFEADVLSNGQKTVIVYFDFHFQGTAEYSQQLFTSLLAKINLIKMPTNFLIEGLDKDEKLKFDSDVQFQDLPQLISQSPIKLDFLQAFDWIETNKQILPSNIKFYDVDLKCREMVSDFWKIKLRINYTDSFYNNLTEQDPDYNKSVEQKIPEEIKERFRIFATKTNNIVNVSDYFTNTEIEKYKNLTFRNLFTVIKNERDLIISSLKKIVTNKEMEEEINEIYQHAEERINEWQKLLLSNQFLNEILFQLNQKFSNETELFNFIIDLPILSIYWKGLVIQDQIDSDQNSEILRTLDLLLGNPDASLSRIVDLCTLDNLINENSTILSVVFLGGIHANQVIKYLQYLGYKTINQIPATNLNGEKYPDFYSAYYDSKNIKLLEPNCFDLI